jgi:hypothetical protein
VVVTSPVIAFLLGRLASISGVNEMVGMSMTRKKAITDVRKRYRRTDTKRCEYLENALMSREMYRL